jgi:hypothetical protein
VMPLQIGCSKTVIRKNIRTLIEEGYPPKVAAAIAYREARAYRKMCKRHDAHLRRAPRTKRKTKKRRRASSSSWF